MLNEAVEEFGSMLYVIKLYLYIFLKNRNDEAWLNRNENAIEEIIDELIEAYQKNPRFMIPVIFEVKRRYHLKRIWLILLRRYPILGLKTPLLKDIGASYEQITLKQMNSDNTSPSQAKQVIPIIFKRLKRYEKET